MDKQGRSRRDAHEDLFDVLEQDGDDPNLRCSQWCVCHKERSEKLLRYIDVVFERDTFEMDLGSSNTIVHRPALRERGDIIGSYAIATMASGVDEIEWMDLDDLNAVRAAGSNGPAWTDWADQMYRKAPYRRLCKRLPLGADYYVALALDGAADVTAQAKIIDVETNGEASRTLANTTAAAEMSAQAGAPDPEEAAEIARQEREASK
jgi:recombinational DNA repair protein RecT